MAATTPGRSGRVDAWIDVCRELFADGRPADEERDGGRTGE